MASINGRSLDDELLSLDETLNELIGMGLVESVSYPEENGIGPVTRYYLTGEAPAMEEETWQPEMAVHI
jgi:hypothetical protein